MSTPKIENSEHDAFVPPPRKPIRWLKPLVGLLVGVPLLVTLIGALTAPKRAATIPVGRLVYLEPDQPSEHTTMLRGLYLIDSRGSSRLLIHEEEDQDGDTGTRSWINQPSVSPDGKAVAFVKQAITLQEEQQSLAAQIWVQALRDPKAKPRLIFDVTKAHMKQIVGLTWTPDSRAVVFLEDGVQICVPVAVQTHTNAGPTRLPLPTGLPLKLSPETSAVWNPALQPGQGPSSDTLSYLVPSTHGTDLKLGTVTVPKVTAYAVSPDGRIASVSPQMPQTIHILDGRTGREMSAIPARWGWSLFGGRKITSVHWSPDSRYIGYTVSKPPVPEDELFTANVATGEIRLLPVRTGRASWDWTR